MCIRDRIRILKQDELDQHVIAGVRFDIYSVDEAGNAADCVAQMTTNEQGIAESPDLFPADYIVMEHAAPTGYEETLWSEKITVGMDELVSRTVTNRPIQGVLRIVKTDSETAKGLPGAQDVYKRQPQGKSRPVTRKQPGVRSHARPGSLRKTPLRNRPPESDAARLQRGTDLPDLR